MNTKISSLIHKEYSGFTLIELLVVIGIIGVLAAMLFPALSSAKTRAKVATARVEMKGIETAIKAYQADYTAWPTSKEARAVDIDITFGTVGPNGTGVLVNKRKQTLGLVVNTAASSGNAGYQANNSEVISILLALETFRNGAPTRNNKNRYNPKKINFLDAKSVDNQSSSGVGPDGVFRDPWGNPYIISIDMNSDNRTRDSFYSLRSVSANGDSLQGANGLAMSRTSGGNFELQADVMVWSMGPDGQFSANAPANFGVNKDNILSWK